MVSRALVAALASAAVLLTACGGGTDTGAGEARSPSPTEPAATETASETPSESSPSPEEARTTEAPQAQTQLRAVWVHLFDDTLKTPHGVDEMLDRVAASGANTVIAEVVRRHDAYYDSEVLPRTTDPDLQEGFDPLQRLVDGAKERGISLHAWVPLMPAYHPTYDSLPAPPSWVWTEHGKPAAEPERWVTRFADGSWGDYLDPGVPAVRDHVVAVLTEIASSYDVDAVHLDYLRYTAEEAGYNPVALRRFQAEMGRTDVPIPTDQQWSDWRREQTRSLAQRIREEVAEVAPDVGVTAAVIAQGEGPHAGHPFTATRGYSEYFQDWRTWLQQGLVDVAMPMDYFEEAVHAEWFRQWIDFSRALADQVDPLVAPGIGAWLNPVADGEKQLRDALEGTDGAVIYSYQQTANAEPSDALLRRLSESLWAEPAPAPDLR